MTLSFACFFLPVECVPSRAGRTFGKPFTRTVRNASEDGNDLLPRDPKLARGRPERGLRGTRRFDCEDTTRVLHCSLSVPYGTPMTHAPLCRPFDERAPKILCSARPNRRSEPKILCGRTEHNDCYNSFYLPTHRSHRQVQGINDTAVTQYNTVQ